MCLAISPLQWNTSFCMNCSYLCTIDECLEHLSHIAVLVLQLFIDTVSESCYVQWTGSVWWRLNSKITSKISSRDLLGRRKLHVRCFQCCSWDMTPLTPCIHWNCSTERKGWLHRYLHLFMVQKCEFENMWAQTHGTYRKMRKDCIWNAVGPFKIIQPFSYSADLFMV
jgi:hypothetical protein